MFMLKELVFCIIKLVVVIAILFLFLVHIYLVKLFVIFICKKCYINEVYLRKSLLALQTV